MNTPKKRVALMLFAAMPLAACVTSTPGEMLCWQQAGQYVCTPLAAVRAAPAAFPGSSGGTIHTTAPPGSVVITQPGTGAAPPTQVALNGTGVFADPQIAAALDDGTLAWNGANNTLSAQGATTVATPDTAIVTGPDASFSTNGADTVAVGDVVAAGDGWATAGGLSVGTSQ
jgi:hypothetical protein